MIESLKAMENLAAVASGVDFEPAYAASHEDILEVYAFFIRAADLFEEDDSLEWLELVDNYTENINLFLREYTRFPDYNELREIMSYAQAQTCRANGEVL